MTARLIIDLETTGLDPDTLTVLEAAWCVTDLNGTQRTPLRQRFCQISVSELPCYPDHISLSTPSLAGTWINQHTCDPYALNMARESGLYDDWLACPATEVVRTSAELARLLIDDLVSNCDMGERNPQWHPLAVRHPDAEPIAPWLREPERIYLGGMGVAQFDQPVLRELMPAVVPPFGQTGLTHYRPGGDVSIAQTALLGGCEDEKLIQWATNKYGPEFCAIDLGVTPDYCWADRDVFSWFGDKRVHRAAADVARGVVLQRALWRFAAPLRDALGLAGVE
jgi:hypothetical protein